MSEVNRTIRDNPALDDVDHALGRPFDPFNSYRNRYATSGKQSERLRKSAWWEFAATDGNLDYFRVTEAGKKALAEELRKPEYGRVYEIWWKGQDTPRPYRVVAKSRSAAKYAAYMEADTQTPFVDYCADISSVRLFKPKMDAPCA